MKQKLQLTDRLNIPIRGWLLVTLLFNVLSSYAIPSIITGNYNVTGPDNCPTTCTIQNGGVLTITGSSTIATFNGSITVMPGGKLIVKNNATVKMAANTKIVVKGPVGTLIGGYMYVPNGRLLSAGANVFWSGIETSKGTPSSIYIQKAVVAIGDNNYPYVSSIENAIVGIRNYDSGNPVINATSGGSIDVRFTIMRNNIKHLAIFNNLSSSIPTNITQTTNNINFQMLFQYVKFINTANFNPPVTPVEMVYLNNCSIFLSGHASFIIIKPLLIIQYLKALTL